MLKQWRMVYRSSTSPSIPPAAPYSQRTLVVDEIWISTETILSGQCCRANPNLLSQQLRRLVSFREDEFIQRLAADCLHCHSVGSVVFSGAISRENPNFWPIMIVCTGRSEPEILLQSPTHQKSQIVLWTRGRGPFPGYKRHSNCWMKMCSFHILLTTSSSSDKLEFLLRM